MAHLVHHVMGHVAVQRPVAGVAATNSIVRVVPTGTSTVVSGMRARRRDRAAVGRDDLERVAVEVDRVVIHRAEVPEADAHAVADLGDERLRSPGTPCR